ncbi:MAG: Trp biosynthesis-associated membrane protein [Actinobacteria bacterium]|nr:Trp biosynthesis-associated membrane protein [Actinomycetota bacterium]
MTDARRLFALALVADLLGAATVLLAARPIWQRVTVSRPRPLSDQVVSVSGHALDGALGGLGIVALAGIVAVLATRGWGRRFVGAFLVLTGAVIGWRAANGLAALSPARARSLASSAHAGIGVDATSAVHVHLSSGWAILTLVGGLLVLGGGALVALRGAGWSAMSSRYEAPTEAGPEAAAEALDDVALWKALDRGDDPTRS